MKNTKLKAFCVKSSDLTDQELKIMLERCVDLGAEPCDWIDGAVSPKSDDCTLYPRDNLTYWGLTMRLCTYTANQTDSYKYNLISKEEAFELLGIETKVAKPISRLEPFCVKSSDLTDRELNKMLEGCVALGAEPMDWVRGYYDKAIHIILDREDLPYWGVNEDCNTYTYDSIGKYNDNLLTKGEAFEMLGIETKVDKPVSRLEPFCINSSDVSEEDLLLILKRCKELGACIHEWVSTPETVENGLRCFDKNSSPYWGLTSVYDFYRHHKTHQFDDNVLTKDEAFQMLGLTIKPTIKLGEPKEDTLPETLQEANCSLTIDNKEFIVFDKDTDLTYYLSDEDQVEGFVQELSGIKKFLRLEE